MKTRLRNIAIERTPQSVRDGAEIVTNVEQTTERKRGRRETRAVIASDAQPARQRLLRPSVLRPSLARATPPPSPPSFHPCFLPSLCMNNNSGRTQKRFCHTKSVPRRHSPSDEVQGRNHLVTCMQEGRITFQPLSSFGNNVQMQFRKFWGQV